MLFTHIDPALLFSIFSVAVFLLIAFGLTFSGLVFFGVKISGAVFRKVARSRGSKEESAGIPPVVAAILDRQVPRAAFARFTDGFRTPIDGLRILNSYPPSDLWRYGVAPAVCSLLVTSLILSGLIAVIGSAAPSIHEAFGDTWLERIYEAGTFLLLIAITAAVAFVSWLLLQTAFCGFFFSLLAVRVEQKIGTADEELKEPPILTQMLESISDILIVIFASAALFLLNVLPIVGSIIAVVCTGYVNSLFAGFEFLDYPLIARGVRRKERRRFEKANRWSTHGLGSFVVCVALIPGVGAILLCTAAAGSVALHHRLKRNEENNGAFFS